MALSEEISSRENLIEQLQRNEQRMQAMRTSYETKLRELNDNIRSVEQARDKVLLEKSALTFCVASITPNKYRYTCAKQTEY